eukprot:m51a1_g3288 hypothetical protein (658) ;mRNA; r:270609-272810
MRTTALCCAVVALAVCAAATDCVLLQHFESVMKPSAGAITWSIPDDVKPFVTYLDGNTVSVQVFGPQGVSGEYVKEDHKTRVITINIPHSLIPRAAEDISSPSVGSSRQVAASTAGTTSTNVALAAAGVLLASRGNVAAAAATVVPALAYAALGAKPADECALHIVITRPASKKPANLIFVISDGHSVAGITLARKMLGSYWLDKYLVGTVRTKSASSEVTDSSASATAYACGIKTNNDWLGVDPKNKSCRTLMEAARDKGMATGLTVTSSITHATPGAFYAHTHDRNLEYLIGDQLYNSDLTVALGGGSMFFQNQREKYGNKTLIEMFKAKGYRYVNTVGQLKNAGTEPKLFGTFNGYHFPFAIDRKNMNYSQIPSLVDEVKAALAVLNKATETSGKGFFMMIEASMIDYCSHFTDPDCLVEEVREFLAATKVAFDFAENHGNTAVVVTSDHETGGIALGATAFRVQNEPHIYYYRPEEIKVAQPARSLEAISNELVGLIKAPLAGGKCGVNGKMLHNLTVEEVTTTVNKYLNVKNWTDDDAKYVIYAQTGLVEETNNPCTVPSTMSLTGALGTVITKRTYVAYGTQSHSGGDVMLYGYNAPGLKGNMENTDLSKWMAEYLGVESEVPKILSRRDVSDNAEDGAILERSPAHPYDH